MPVTIVGNNTPTAGGVVYGDGTNYASTAAGTSGQPVVSGGAGAPVFRPYTLPASDGSANQILQTNGSGALSFVTVSASGLTLLSTVTASASATVDITTNINSTYDKYIIDVINMTPNASGNGAFLNMRTSTDVGANFDAGASDYNYQISNLSSGSYAQSQNDATTAMRVDNNGTTNTASIGGLCFSVSMFTPSNTSTNKVFTWTGGGAINATPTMGVFWGSGSRRSTSAINAVRFVLSAGLIQSGIFRLYGVRTS